MPEGEDKRECPVCKAVLPVDPRYVTWCDEGGWNVNPRKPEPPRNLFEEFYLNLGEKQSRSLLQGLTQTGELRPTFTISKLLALACATATHGMTLTIGAVGVVLLLYAWWNLFAVIGGLVCFGITVLLRPLPIRPPEDLHSRGELPGLFRLVDTIGASLEARRVAGIVINEDFNAAFGRVGWRQREVLYVGLPLWAMLENEERVALIAHELAHGVNGDAARGFYIGSAAGALARWYALLRPDRIWDESKGIAGLSAVPFSIAMLMLANLAWVAAYALSHLLWRDSQRAEYLADRLAATVSGTGPSLSLLRKLHYGETFALAIHRAVVRQGARSDILDNLRKLGLEAPPGEVERVTRVQQLEGSRLDVTHPPSAYRIDLLGSHYVGRPRWSSPRRSSRPWMRRCCRSGDRFN